MKSADAFQVEISDAEEASQSPSSPAPVETAPEALSAAAQNAIVESASQTLFEFDPAAARLHWSDPSAAAHLLGVDLSALPAETDAFEALIDGDPDPQRAAAFEGFAESYACQYRLKRCDGGRHWVEERGGWIGAGENRRLISVLRSVEEQKRREDELFWLASNDELTGLLNRAYLRKQLDRKIRRLQKTGGHSAFLLAGVDDLGAINEDFGFEEADKVLVAIGQRLSAELGASDLIGRVAGSKFGIIIDDCDEDKLRAISVRLLNSVREQVIGTRNGAVAASVSIGVVSVPDKAASSNDAVSKAEAALDEAKRLGKSSWSAFSEKTDVVSMRRRNSHMSDVILTALNERRIRLAFQPIVSDLGAPAKKFECLIRMQDEDGQEIPAPEFIPAAERLGLVHLLDRRVLELATNTLAVCPDIHLNVNISMETVKDFVWAEGYISLLRANHLLANRITVELTETQVIDAIEASIEFVSEIKKLGCAFAIDDFGAGYTSFRNLKAMDIDILKIDGSFVTGLSSSRDNQLFVRTLLDLARNFGMHTVAEWVDNEADAMLLKGLGVDYLQGFLIGKPEVFPVWLPEGAPNNPLQKRFDAI